MVTPHSGSPQPALLLGRFSLEQTLATGDLTTLARAFDPHLNRPVVIASLAPHRLADPAALLALEQRFAREIEAAARTGAHPHLVQVFDLLHDERRLPFLVREFLPGGTLATRLTTGPLPFPDALRLAADAARGLEAAQSVGLVHRELSPSAISLTSEGRGKVGEFGGAQIDDLAGETVTDAQGARQTLYTSPEQERTGGYVPAATDQYALGLVLFEMLTGRAFKQVGWQEAWGWLGQWPSVLPVMERLLAGEAGGRYGSMREVVIALEQAGAYGAAPAMASAAPAVWQAAPGREGKRRHRRRAVLLGLGGLVVVGAAGGGGYWYEEKRGGSGSGSGGGTVRPATSVAAAVTPVTAATVPAPSAPLPTVPVATVAPATPTVIAGPAPVTSLLSYLDGRVTLPGEIVGADLKTIIGDPVQVVGVDLSRNEIAKLAAVTAPTGSRVVRTIWAPMGTLLATLIRQPVQGGFSDNLDLIVIDIATGKATTVAKSINSLPSWSPDGQTLVYGLITGIEKGTPIGPDGKPRLVNGTPFVDQLTGVDVHLVSADGTKDRVIAHLLPYSQCGGTPEQNDPIVRFVAADQFLTNAQQTAWAADNSRIAFTAFAGTFTFQPDGSDLRQVAGCGATDLGTLIGATTDDPYVPKNNVQVRLQDDEDALHWRYDRGLIPTLIVSGCSGDSPDTPCDNTKKGTANAGYRNQIIARLSDGTEKMLTSSPTFKYHVAVSPDGTAIAFTGITVSDYATAAKYDPAKGYQSYSGYSTDVSVVRLSGGAELKASTTGSGHHPSWQRDIPVKISIRPTPTVVTGTPKP